MTRRRFLTTTGLSALGLSLAACGVTPAPAATQAPAVEPTATAAPAEAGGAKAKVVLAWWSASTEGDRVYEEAVATAREELTDLEIEQQLAPWSDFWQKSQTQAAGGVPPDVTLMSMAYVAQYAKVG
jgi:ABC-type glycerol-3-phosphate transport system substrate-binding protein